MAKIKTIKLELRGEMVDFNISCTSKGVFTADFPLIICTCIDIETKFDTLQAVEKEIHRAVNEVNKMNTETENLIFYSVGYSFRINDWEEQITNHSGITFSYIALRRTSRGKMVNYQKIEKSPFDKYDDPDFIAPGFRLLSNRYNGKLLKGQSIPFSTDAMEMFSEMSAAIKAVGEKIESFTTPDNILKGIGERSLIGLPFNTDTDGNK